MLYWVVNELFLWRCVFGCRPSECVGPGFRRNRERMRGYEFPVYRHSVKTVSGESRFVRLEIFKFFGWPGSSEAINGDRGCPLAESVPVVVCKLVLVQKWVAGLFHAWNVQFTFFCNFA